MVDLFAQAALLLLGSIAVAAVSIPIARATRADRLFAPAGSVVPPAADLIDRLVEVADRAAALGLVKAEETIDAARETLLRQGLRLAIEGVKPAEIRSTLESMSLDASETTENAAARARFAMSAIAAIGITLLGGLLVAILVQRGAPVATPAWLISGLLVSAVVACTLLGFAASRLDSSARAEGQAVLAEMLSIEAATLIAAGAKPAAVRAVLTDLLPPHQRPRLSVKAA